MVQKKPVNDESYIAANYNYFYRLIENMKKEEIGSLYNAITKLIIVGISLDKNDDPQLIFESLNSTGVSLTNSDKIRNYVLMMSSSVKNQEQFYIKYWKPLEELIRQSDMDKFIRYYLALKKGELYSTKSIYEEFKIFCDACSKEVDIEELIKKYLLIYIYMERIMKRF